MQAKFFVILMALAIFIFVIELIRRQKMTFRYSFFWLSTCLVALILSIWDNVLGFLAKAAGFALPSNFVFVLLLAFFLLLSLLLTIYINEQNNRTETLAQKTAILENKLDQLLKNFSRNGDRGK